MNKDRQLRQLRIAPDLNHVFVKFIEIIQHEPKAGEEEGARKQRVYTCKGDNRPHKDLVGEMKKLRKYALDMLGIELADSAKTLKNWTVLKLDIAGDMDLKQSRVKITLGLLVEKTNKISKIETQQAVMYPAADDSGKYHDIDKVTNIVEAIAEECWLYCEGKCEEEEKPNQQLALFNFGDMKIAV